MGKILFIKEAVDGASNKSSGGQASRRTIFL